MSLIQRINNLDELRKAWMSVFVSADPFSDPLSESVKGRLLFYPTYGYHLGKKQYDAFAKTARALHESGFYLSIVEYTRGFLTRGENYFCQFPLYDEYERIHLVLENAIYSMRGTFGILISHENHAIVGGSTDFILELKKNYPDWQEDRRRLLEEWRKDLADFVLAVTV